MQLHEARFLIAAAVLHSAIPALARITPDRDWDAYLLAAAQAPPRSEIDIDISALERLPELEQEAETLPFASPEEALAYRERRATGPRGSDLRMPPASTPTSDPEAEPPPESEAGSTLVTPNPDAPSEYGMPPPRGALDGSGSGLPPGVGGPEVWRRYPGTVPLPDKALPAPTAAPRRDYDRKRATKVIQDGQRVADKKLGLDFPGRATVKKVFESAVYGHEVPFPSSASFTVAVNAQGRVTQVTLNGHAGGDAGAWAQVTKAAKAQLAAHTFALKDAFKKGATLSVGVNASMKMPGGGTARDGATFSFDVTDIGARPRRVVAVSVGAIPVP